MYESNETAKATATATVSFPLAGILGITFIVLKLTGVIDWSWWWVLAPFWIPFVLYVAGAVLFFVGVLIVDAVKAHKNKK